MGSSIAHQRCQVTEVSTADECLDLFRKVHWAVSVNRIAFVTGCHGYKCLRTFCGRSLEGGRPVALYRRSEVDLDFLDFVPFNPEILRVPKSSAILQLAFIADEGFITFLKKLFNVDGTDLVAPRPTLFSIFILVDVVVVVRASKCEIFSK